MKKSDTIDARLVKRIQTGEMHLLNTLVKRWHKRFCEKAYWIVRDADQSKDVAQESWRTILSRINDLEDPFKFKYWALRIVCSKALDTLRDADKKRRALEIIAKQKDITQLKQDTNNDTLKHEMLKAIQQLPVKQQEVLKLFYTENYSIKDIAEIVKVSIGTVKSRLYHARETLKHVLKGKTK